MLLIPTLLCPKAWEGMSGDEATRFCTYCKKHVHNLEAMSVSERLALLSSPAASICARYKIAIRRPRKGHEESYMRRLMKCGVGVALAGSALVILWEMYDENERRTFYRAVATMPPDDPYPPTSDADGLPGAKPPGTEWTGFVWPEPWYVEVEAVILGAFSMPTLEVKKLVQPSDVAAIPRHIDLDLDPVEIDKLLQPARPATIELKTDVPVKKKKIRKFPGLRGWGT